MIKKEITIAIEKYDSIEALSAPDQVLLQQSRTVTQQAYAPYSSFVGGAVAQLVDGSIVTGTNQENAAYPVGICAERVVLAAVASQFNAAGIVTMAISYHNLNGKSSNPVSPCGMCRQSLVEYEARTKQPIRILLSGMMGEVYVIEKAKDLLPLAFSSTDMQ